MKAFLLYSSLRLALFVGVAALLYLLGMRDLLLVAVALLVSGLLSFTLLSGQRDRLSTELAARKAALDERNAARTAAEDAANDALRESLEARRAGTAAAAPVADPITDQAHPITDQGDSITGQGDAVADQADPPAEPEPPRDA